MTDLEIGIFTPMFSEINGTAKASRSLAIALAKAGAQIHVYAPNVFMTDHIIPNLHIHKLKSTLLKREPALHISVPWLKYFNPHEFSHLDVTHSMSVDPISMLGMDAAKLNKIPKVATHHSPYAYYVEEYFGVMGKMIKTFTWDVERILYNRYDLISTPTISKKELIKKYGMSEPILAISNGIEKKYFKKVDFTPVLEKYHLHNKKILLYASRMSPEKHPREIVRIFGDIIKKIPNAHLVLVGKGPEVKPLAKLIRALNLQNFVTQTGYVPFNELLMWYKAADVSCIWSFVEAQGLVILESMAQGTPIVGTFADGIKDVIIDGKTGYLAKNLDELKEKVIYLFQNDDVVKNLGENARKYAEMHQIENIAKTWIKVYKKLINCYPIAPDPTYQASFQRIWKSFAEKNPGVIY